VRIVDAGTVAFRVKGVTVRYAVTFANASGVLDVYRIVCLRSNHHRRGRHPTFRMAVGRVVEEHGIATSETDSDLPVFMDEHESDVMGESNFISLTR
jgi:hypothetical protein